MSYSVPIKHAFSSPKTLIQPTDYGSEKLYHYSLPSWHEFGTGMYEDANELASGKLLLKGDEILVSKLNPVKGAVILAEPHDCLTVSSPEFIPLRAKNIHRKFAYYLMLSGPIRFQLEASVESVTNSHKRARVDKFLATRISIPDLATQRQITDFLDRETARIDLLIEKKQKMVELLDTKNKHELISLIEQFAMKQTGRRIKHFTKIVGGGTPSKDKLEYWDNGKILWVSPKDMKQDLISDTEDKITPEAVKESSTGYIPENTVLIVARSGILQHTIPVALTGKVVTLNQDMKGFLITSSELISEYLFVWIKAYNQRLLQEWRQEGATVESLNSFLIQNTYFDPPPVTDQMNIFYQYSKLIFLLTDAKAKISLSVEKLKEYRSSLITAAVTGQINITDWIKAGNSDRKLDSFQAEISA